MLVARHASRLLVSTVRYVAATGQWWVVLVGLVLALGALIGPATKVVVAPSLYVLF